MRHTLFILSVLALTSSLSGCQSRSADSKGALPPPTSHAPHMHNLIVIEAESFATQSLDDKRRWLVFSKNSAPHHYADADPLHTTNASNGKYIEILPDTRTTHNDAVIEQENFTNQAGTVAALSYPTYFANPGIYYVWARAYSTGSEDNGVHIGLNGQWPKSSQRLQLCEGKHQWSWSSAQRTQNNHCGVPNTIVLTIPSAGVHNVMVSMREDGFELDKLLLTTDKYYVPQGQGPTAEPVAKSR